MNSSPHISVMVNEVVDALAPRNGAIYVDATFGAGGYSRALLGAADCTVWGIDRDPLAIAIGEDLAKAHGRRLTVLSGRFGDMETLLADVGVRQVDGIVLDLGVSSMQIDDPARGFSFRADGPLDMRMNNADGDAETAADVVNRMAERELADIIYIYGEERASKRIAHAIVQLRDKEQIKRTEQLAALVRRVVRKSKDGIDPATRTFQALRIYVNDELHELEKGMSAAESVLAPGGRLAVVSFHSLEDRRVKLFMQERAGQSPRPSRHMPELQTKNALTFRLIKRGAVKPRMEESSRNPRARSARLRWAERTDTPIQDAA